MSNSSYTDPSISSFSQVAKHSRSTTIILWETKQCWCNPHTGLRFQSQFLVLIRPCDCIILFKKRCVQAVGRTKDGAGGLLSDEALRTRCGGGKCIPLAGVFINHQLNYLDVGLDTKALRRLNSADERHRLYWFGGRWETSRIWRVFSHRRCELILFSMYIVKY